MPSNRQKNGNASGAAAAGGESAAKVAENIQGAANAAVEQVNDAAQPTNTRIDDAKEKVAEVYNTVQTEAQVYVDKGKQAVENAKESAKEAAANIQQKTYDAVDNAKKTAQPYVDQAKQTAKPYVDQAKQTAQPYVEKAQAMKRGVDKSVEDVNNFDITKTTFFATLIVMAGSVLAWMWFCVESINAVKVVVVAISDKSNAIGLSGKLWEAYYYSTVILEHVPVVGYRAAEVLRLFMEQTVDEARKQIRRKEVEATKKKQ